MDCADPAFDLETADGGYVLDEQAGFLLRQVTQRHTAIFAARMPEGLTPTQWAVLAKLVERGPVSQNALGRQTCMDAATTKGVVDRLAARGLVATEPDALDARRLMVTLTPAGRGLARRATPFAEAITRETLAPLDPAERRVLLRLLRKLR